MAYHQPFQVTGFHSCDRKVGLEVLNGNIELNHSNNRWDWLGKGIYFLEQNPFRALEYAVDSAKGDQFNRVRIKTPFVLGAIIELGNCLNLVEPQSLSVLKEAHNEMERLYKVAGRIMPVNKGDNRVLDCSVIKFVHQSRKEAGQEPYDTYKMCFC